MNFFYPVAFWGLLSIPALLLIYFFHKSFKALKVSALFLWHKAETRTGAGIKFNNLIKNLLLFLEILILLFLVLAASGPYIRNKQIVYKVVFVLDSSASMGVKGEDGKNAKQKAIQKAEDFLRDKEPFLAYLILSGFQERLITAEISDLSQLEAGFAEWITPNIYHSLLPCLEKAKQIAGEEGFIIVLSDREPPSPFKEELPGYSNISWWAFGCKQDNMGITQAFRRYENPARESGFVVIQNFSDTPKQTTLQLWQEGGIITQYNLFFEKGEKTKTVSFETERSDKIWELKLAQDDALDLDNIIFLVPEKESVILTQLEINNNQLQTEIFKILDVFAPQIQFVTANPALIITDYPLDPEDLVLGEESIWILEFQLHADKYFYGPYIIDKSHPFTRELLLSGVRWPAQASGQEGYPLISTGNIPLLVQKDTGIKGISRFVFNIDLMASNLRETLNWPVFWSNFIKVRQENLQGLSAYNVRLGEIVLGRFNRVQSLKLKAEDGRLTEIKGEAGFFSFLADKRGVNKVIMEEKEWGDVSFMFLSENESDLGILRSGRWGSLTTENIAADPHFLEVGWIFLLFVLFVFIIHCNVLKRVRR